jgi:heme-degrading monooxygenase HmoA
VAMTVVTRLRLRDPRYFDDFFASAVAAVEQAESSEGNLGAEVLAEAHSTYWTRTCWENEEAMRLFMLAEPHRSTMDRIDEWCDEATFVNWQQTEAALPDWDIAYERLISHGHVVDLPDASPDNAERAFPPPSQSQ